MGHRYPREHLLPYLLTGRQGVVVGTYGGTFVQHLLDVSAVVELHLVDPDLSNPTRNRADSGPGMSVSSRSSRRQRLHTHGVPLDTAPDDILTGPSDWILFHNTGEVPVERLVRGWARSVQVGGWMLGDRYYQGVHDGLPLRQAAHSLVANEGFWLVDVICEQFVLQRGDPARPATVSGGPPRAVTDRLPDAAISPPPGSFRRLIRLSGLQRSGNHAVIGWLMHNLAGPCLHLNNVREPDWTPFASFDVLQLREDRCWRHWCSGRTDGRSLITPPIAARKLRGLLARRTPPHLLMSYESTDPSAFSRPLAEQVWSTFAGAADRADDVLILRDPYNLFASMMRAGMLTPVNQARCVHLWKQHARCFREWTSHPEGRLAISFNRWVSNEAYRSWILEALDTTGRGSSYQRVHAFGGGSSFSGTTRDGRAHDLRVLERWRCYQDQDGYRRVFEDRELVELSESIFTDLGRPLES